MTDQPEKLELTSLDIAAKQREKLIEILHLDLGGGELFLIEGCSVEVDPEHRLLLSNADLGFPLLARDVQAGLDFHTRPSELFEGKEMGEDALRLLVEYRNLLQDVRGIVDREIKVKKESLRWYQTLKISFR